MPVKVASASLRDRTQEFQSIAERLKKSFSSVQNGPISSNTNSGSRSEEQRTTIAMQSEFNRRASKIGFGIHQTSQKLAKLAKCKLILSHYTLLSVLFCLERMKIAIMIFFSLSDTFYLILNVSLVLRIHSISYLFVRLFTLRVPSPDKGVG